MPLHMLRAKAAVLCRIQTSCRSDDAAKVNRAFASRSGAGGHAGLFPGPEPGQIRMWRYFRPKNVSSLAGNMSGWTDLGEPRFRDDDDTEKYCTAACLQVYKERTDPLPRASREMIVGNVNGTVLKDFPFFISIQKRKGQHHAVKSETIAKDVLRVMDLAGIDVNAFKAHCLRHSSLQAKKDFGVERDIFLASAKMSGQVFDRYYNVPILRHDDADADRTKMRSRMMGLQQSTQPTVDSQAIMPVNQGSSDVPEMD